MYLIIIKIHQRRIISSNWRKMISQIIFNYEQLILTKETDSRHNNLHKLAERKSKVSNVHC